MISIIIPFYNEKESIPVLVKGLVNQMEKIKKEFEIVLVDDGSNDNLEFKIQNSETSKNIKLINHRKRLGKGRALKTGIENSNGEIIVFMDGDLQDNPKDIIKFLKKIDEGYDLVNGVRMNRKENIIVKTYSKIASWFLRTFLHSPFTDINCGFKAFDREVLKDINFYGNNFRFFPLATYLNGYKVSEVPVTNNQRKFGSTKFGKSKIFVGILDTMTAYFLFKFSEKPLHFFGMIGGVTFFIGFAISFYLTIERLFFGVLLVTRPLLWLGILLIIVGIQVVMTGIIGELIVYLSKNNNK
ncbi:MAG: glycosyltransferase family 2 protein [Patescibacteria group bacterium]|jgi:glycosyltransferase involved in cell wall biosynthesis